MKKTLFYNIPILAFLTFASIFSSCKKENSIIGLDVQPASDKMIVCIDSTVVFHAYNILDDTIKCSGSPNVLLGSYTDPVLGQFDASFAAQFRIPDNNVVFKNILEEEAPLVADRLVLYLDVDLVYGNKKNTGEISNGTNKIHVYRLKEIINDTLDYYTNHEIKYDYIEVGSTFFSPYTAVADKNAEISIELSNELANELLLADTSNYLNNEAFTSFFKGLYVTTDIMGTEGSMSRLDLLSTTSHSKLTLFFNEKYHYNFYINSNSAIISKFDHDYNGLLCNISEINDNIEDTMLFNQGAGGVNNYIKIDNFEHWQDSNIAINKAVLVIPVDFDENDDQYTPTIARMMLYTVIEEDLFGVPYDYLFGDEYVGGYYDADTKTYRFNLTRYFQKLLNGEEVYNKLKMIPENTKIIPHRSVMLNGTGENKIKLLLTYTKL
ncbi:MAG: hypothetical protein A2W91_12510 [Bacteroidetes bacterium GWF2_38_335]|nr:MAG: hypothetical protein A2W91_12510 [Bacteroidetes bacterium GWF2_38_335]OFY76990.1 MAG: hypothetical protein A2281_00625 [Bacteroidetes bacterium RIFOXYA12_FULL_38_20]HBS86846.1 hypothetical protein [Bacteroidales bacterium]